MQQDALSNKQLLWAHAITLGAISAPRTSFDLFGSGYSKITTTHPKKLILGEPYLLDTKAEDPAVFLKAALATAHRVRPVSPSTSDRSGEIQKLPSTLNRKGCRKVGLGGDPMILGSLGSPVAVDT